MRLLKIVQGSKMRRDQRERFDCRPEEMDGVEEIFKSSVGQQW